MKGSFLRFLVVGLVNTAVGLSIMYVLLHIFHHYWAATFIGNAAGAVVSYVLNRIFTFKSGVHLSKSILRFILVIGVCYGLSYYIGLQFSSWLLHQLPAAVRPFKKRRRYINWNRSVYAFKLYGSKILCIQCKQRSSRHTRLASSNYEMEIGVNR